MRRYQKLYNSLTFCEFYNDDPKKRVQINKDVFSPHNVKTVLVGAEGAIIYYYVTYQEGKLNPKRSYSVVNFNGCNSVGNNMKPNSKGIMDVFLGNGTLSFNGIEEIVFFTGGWNNEVEFNFEVNKLDNFMRNIPTSMNRLCRVALIDRSIFEFHQVISQNQRSGQSVISTKGSVVNQMKKLGFECYSINSLNTPNGQIEVKYNAKVDSMGLLPRPRFDSSNYKLDAEYDESKNNGKVTVECRLSHYFYTLEKQARKRVEEEASRRAKEDAEGKAKKDVGKNKPIYDFQLESAAKATLNKLDRLYNPLWGNNYEAIFCGDGTISMNKDKTSLLNKRSILKAIYDAWATFAIGDLAVSDVDTPDLDLSYGYLPGFHKMTLRNKNSWQKYKSMVYDVLLSNYAKYFEKDNRKINELGRRVTNCLIVKSSNNNQIILRLTGIGEENLESFKQQLKANLNDTYLAGSAKGKIAELSGTDIIDLTYIFDYEGFKNEILFAYKQYKSGENPLLTEAILGLKMNGTPLKTNLLETGRIVNSIIAGSRSGKGTMTMGLLACLFGAGGSVVYMDYKPDIGAMLWDLEREYQAKGLDIKLLSVDAADEIQAFSGTYPIRPIGISNPLDLNVLQDKMKLLPADSNKVSEFKTLRMLKLFQLMQFIGKYKSSEIEPALNIKAKNIFFILDELTGMNKKYYDFLAYIKSKAGAAKKAAEKKSATQEEIQLHNYYTKLLDLSDEVSGNLGEGLNKDWGQSGLRLIFIGQELNSNWHKEGKGFGTTFAGKLLSSSHMTYAGRKQVNAETYVLDKDQEALAKEKGVFVQADKAPTAVDENGEKVLGLKGQASRFTQFRSYFSLVQNDFNYAEFIKSGSIGQYVQDYPDRFTSQFLGNYQNKSVELQERAINELYDFENNRNREEVTFSGLLKVMQQAAGISDEQLVVNMNQGYNLVNSTFMHMNLGNYSCVEEYLYDCSPESIFSMNELLRKFKGDADKEVGGSFKIYDVDEYNPMGSEDQQNYIPMSSRQSSTMSQQTPSQIDHQEFQHPRRPPRPQRPQIQQPISMSYDNDTVTQQFKQDNIVPTNQSRHNKGMTNALMNMDNNSDEFKKVLQSAQSPEVYNGKITIPDNPFKKYNISTNSGAFLSVKECSDIIMREIEKEISPANIVKRFQVHKDGTIAIDGIKFKPEFDAQFLTSLPMSIRNDVYHGQLIELFDLRNVYRFKNLEEFIIEPMNIAQGRARKEMGIGFRKKWNVLFDKMKSLQVIKVGDIPYYRYNPDEDGERSFLDLFKNDPSSTYSHNSGSLLEKVWDSKPCRLFTGTFGWGIGIQATVLLATMMGPFGLLAGGIAAYNTMKAMRNNDANSSNRVYTEKNTTQSKTNKKTVKRD